MLILVLYESAVIDKVTIIITFTKCVRVSLEFRKI